jgi:hypothetical protein
MWLRVCCVQVSLPPRVAREAVNADELRLQINAAYISGLPQVCVSIHTLHCSCGTVGCCRGVSTTATVKQAQLLVGSCLSYSHSQAAAHYKQFRLLHHTNCTRWPASEGMPPCNPLQRYCTVPDLCPPSHPHLCCPQCQGALTKLIIMDSSGSDKARDLARALTSLGQPLSYVMTGGFKGWAAAELPVEEDAVEYDASTGVCMCVLRVELRPKLQRYSHMYA